WACGGRDRARAGGATAQPWQWRRSGGGAGAAARDVAAAQALPAPGVAGTAGEAAGDAVSPQSNALSVFLASTCNDSEWPEDVDAYRAAVAEDRVRFPMFGAAAANIVPCAYWPEPLEGPVQISDEGPRTVLILQNRRDPVTP